MMLPYAGEEDPQYRERIEAAIQKFGVMLMGFGCSCPDPNHPRLVHTLGCHEKGQPELIMSGDNGSRWGLFLSQLANAQKARGYPFFHGERNQIESIPFVVVECWPSVKSFTNQITRYYGTNDFALRQIVLLDESGRHPAHPSCAEPFRYQRSLGPVPFGPAVYLTTLGALQISSVQLGGEYEAG